MSTIDANFWDERYRQGLTGWDIGYPSTPLKEYIDQMSDQEITILIPGAGNAYEAEYFFKKNFRNTTVLDISGEAILSFKKRAPDFPENKIVHQNFFDHEGQYDLILEQTFFCALDPALRKDYAKKVFSLLKPGGILAGVLFNIEFEKQGPPFGGTVEEYQNIFSPYFSIEIMEDCYNSIPPRSGSEAFIKLRRAD